MLTSLEVVEEEGDVDDDRVAVGDGKTSSASKMRSPGSLALSNASQKKGRKGLGEPPSPRYTSWRTAKAATLCHNYTQHHHHTL